jgi:hypothetical protein
MLLEKPIEVIYAVGAKGCGVSKIELNGRPLTFERDHNPYREGAVRVAIEAVKNALQAKKNRLDIAIG